MSFFNNLKVSLKLSALLLIALLSISVISYTGYFYLQRANSQLQIPKYPNKSGIFPLPFSRWLLVVSRLCLQ